MKNHTVYMRLYREVFEKIFKKLKPLYETAKGYESPSPGEIPMTDFAPYETYAGRNNRDKHERTLVTRAGDHR